MAPPMSPKFRPVVLSGLGTAVSVVLGLFHAGSVLRGGARQPPAVLNTPQ
jgi:hypothetical protein